MNETPVFEQELLFEENYLKRTHKTLTSNPAVALTELVANAWDAGATRVDISIPSDVGSDIVVSDNGIGLSFKEFLDRWFKLGYDRLAHQSKTVQFPSDVEQQGRLAFGRNGVGRHGMFCFNEKYEVISRHNGIEFTALVNSTHDHPINLESHSEKSIDSALHGMTLKTTVVERLPNPEEMLNALSARFVTDPSFQISVNGQSVHIEALSGLIETAEMQIGDIHITLRFIDAEKSLRKGIYQGVAFWQNRRLVGEPSWTLGKESILDGRRSEAKRFVFIAESCDLGPFVKDDWTGFISSPIMDAVFIAVREAVINAIAKANSENALTIQSQVKDDFAEQYKELSPLAKYQVDETFEHIALQHPTEGRIAYEIAMDTVINIAKGRSGQELLKKLSSLDVSEVDALNAILDKWSVKDALAVLDEIDRRLSTIEAIKRFSERPDTDEVHVLEPLITEARWIFGPEYDSMEYCANNQLRTIAKTIFGATDASFMNEKKRPDLFVVANSTYSLTGISEIESGVEYMKRILILEIKKGGFRITRKEKDQAQHYVEDILGAGLGQNLRVDAFVVGMSVDPKAAYMVEVAGKAGSIRPLFYSQLVDTANTRLFNLRKVLQDRYDSISDYDVLLKGTQEALPGFN